MENVEEGYREANDDVLTANRYMGVPLLSELFIRVLVTRNERGMRPPMIFSKMGNDVFSSWAVFSYK